MIPIMSEIIYLSADQATATGSNFVYYDHLEFRPYSGPVEKDNSKKETPCYESTQRRLDGRFQK